MRLILLFFTISTTLAKAQTHAVLYPDLEGIELLEAIQTNYKPDTVMTYGRARDTMFAKIYNINDSLEGVYTGYRLYLDPGLDPTDAAYMNGIATGINTEHTYPRSKGAENGNPKSDMHHLFATRTPVNGDRGSMPFADINDASAIKWYRDGSAQTNIPPGSIRDEFSELGIDAFEPRESHKGNVARAMMYFYTMYRTQANSADPDYFESQRETLLRWHQQDPVDQTEYDRTWQIAAFQSGKPNPFVLDTVLAYRIYCVNDMGVCNYTIPTSTVSHEVPANTLGQNFPNPAIDSATSIPYAIGATYQVKLTIFDVLGQKVKVLVNERQAAGAYTAHCDLAQLMGDGIFYYRLELKNATHEQTLTKAMLVW